MKDGVILRVNKPARMGIDDASLYPLQPCLPRGLRSALLRKASVLRNWLLRKWDARQPSSAFSRSPLMLQSRVLLHCCVLRMCAETNFSHPFLRKLQLHILNASTESEINTAFYCRSSIGPAGGA